MSVEIRCGSNRVEAYDTTRGIVVAKAVRGDVNSSWHIGRLMDIPGITMPVMLNVAEIHSHQGNLKLSEVSQRKLAVAIVKELSK